MSIFGWNVLCFVRDGNQIGPDPTIILDALKAKPIVFRVRVRRQQALDFSLHLLPELTFIPLPTVRVKICKGDSMVGKQAFFLGEAKIHETNNHHELKRNA